MDKLESVIISMGICVIGIGLFLLISGVVGQPNTKYVLIDLGFGVLTMFLGSFLIFIRIIFMDKKPISFGVVD